MSHIDMKYCWFTLHMFVVLSMGLLLTRPAPAAVTTVPEGVRQTAKINAHDPSEIRVAEYKPVIVTKQPQATPAAPSSSAPAARSSTPPAARTRQVRSNRSVTPTGSNYFGRGRGVIGGTGVTVQFGPFGVSLGGGR